MSNELGDALPRSFGSMTTWQMVTSAQVQLRTAACSKAEDEAELPCARSLRFISLPFRTRRERLKRQKERCRAKSIAKRQVRLSLLLTRPPNGCVEAKTAKAFGKRQPVSRRRQEIQLVLMSPMSMRCAR
ncbi:hypothetical protein M514_05588 [Trichuris suis]|uniref:Uncharacterized protein n=1 Tax=Trichuris suis TaxID=68888 RepID=A0A085M8D6_9BILA|nr:hypothetical protein M513_05588 [Trichuris suis]KFD71850.1 hypothetical protein M514_05588 [Trichuris suis]